MITEYDPNINKPQNRVYDLIPENNNVGFVDEKASVLIKKCHFYILIKYIKYICGRTSEFETFDADHTKTGPEETLT